MPSTDEPNDRRTSLWTLLVIGPLLVAGLAGALVALLERESDTAFIFDQQNPPRVQPDAVEDAVRRAPEPAPERRARGRRAECQSSGEGDLRNPWRCTVDYPSGKSIRYAVTIEQNGQYTGIDRSGQLRIYGCCVQPGRS